MEFWLLLTGVSGVALGVGVSAYLHQSTKQHAKALQQQKEQWIAEQAQLSAQLEAVQAQRDAYAQRFEETQAANQHLQSDLARMEVRIQENKKRMEDWTQQREQAVKDAQAAVLKAGQDLSSKLLEDHKREAEEAKKQNEERVKAVSEQTFKQLEEVQKAFAVLKNQQHSNEQKMQTVWQALTAPSSVGQMAEVGLENLLKSLGLEAGRDFVMQYAMAHHEQHGRQLRPDALLFLPQDVLMVVDAKASKFLLEMVEEAKTEGQSAEAGLKRTMQQHLKSLSGKDYRTAMEKDFAQYHPQSKPRQVWVVMYVPSDAMLAKVREIDADFFQRAEQAGIMVAGPSSLSGIMAVASYHFTVARQHENHAIILQQTGDLLDAVVMMTSYFKKLVKHFGTAAGALDEMVASMNARLLPRAKKLHTLGITHSKQAELPQRLASFDKHEQMTVIDQDAEHVLPLENVRKTG